MFGAKEHDADERGTCFSVEVCVVRNGSVSFVVFVKLGVDANAVRLDDFVFEHTLVGDDTRLGNVEFPAESLRLEDVEPAVSVVVECERILEVVKTLRGFTVAENDTELSAFQDLDEIWSTISRTWENLNFDSL